MRYPLNIVLKILGATPQITITDADGIQICHAKQRLLRLVEEVDVYADSSQTRVLCRVKADQVLDVGARYYIASLDGTKLGSVEMDAMDLTWKAHYRILSECGSSMTIEEVSGWLGAVDSFCTEIPFAGPILAACLINPSYHVTAGSDKHVVMRLKKRPALLERRFTLEKAAEIEPGDENLILVSLLMMVLLERRRGWVPHVALR